MASDLGVIHSPACLDFFFYFSEAFSFNHKCYMNVFDVFDSLNNPVSKEISLHFVWSPNVKYKRV